MNTKIRKIKSTVSPAPSRASYGPATAGVEYDTAIDALTINPDGTRRVLQQSIFHTFNIPAGAAAGDYDGVAFISPFKWQLVSVKERHQTLGTDGGAVTLMVKKVPSATAKAAGTDMLSAGLNLKSANDTNQSGAIHATLANIQGAAGDSIGLVSTGVLTAVDGVSVTIEIKRRDS